ncbi:MAG: tetratricopeptide repeat protein [bacterium]
MFSLLFSILAGAAAGLPIGVLVNYGFGIFIGIFVAVALFIFLTRFYTKKLQAVFMEANIFIQKQQFNQAVSVLKGGYKYNRLAFLVKAQIDSQIGIILYTQKKFGEAYKYLQSSNPRIMMGYLMLIIGHIKNNKKDKIDEEINLLLKFNKKDPFAHSAAAYLYEEELKDRDKALEVLTKAVKAMPDNQKIKEHLISFQNNKPFKMEKYGEAWYQLMLDKKGITRLQNKMIKDQQKSMRVKTKVR